MVIAAATIVGLMVGRIVFATIVTLHRRGNQR